MKAWSWIAIVAAVLVSAWSLFFLALAPLGAGEAIYHLLHAELPKAHTEAEAGNIAATVFDVVRNMIEGLAVFLVIPLILTNFTLGVVLWLHLRKKRPTAGPWHD